MKRFLIFICFALLFAFCGKGESNYTVETIEGVRYIKNTAPQWGEKPEVELKFILELGDNESEIEDKYFYMPLDVVCDRDQNIYVLEMTTCEIKKFSKNGEYITKFGRKGEGPGELTVATLFDISPDGNLVVLDAAKQRFQHYSLDGKDAGSYPFTSLVTGYRVLSNGDILGQTPIIPNAENMPEIPGLEISNNTFGIFDIDGNAKSRFGDAYEFSNEKATEMFQDLTFTLTNNDEIFASFRFANAIDRYSRDGELVFRAERPIFFPISDELKINKRELPNGRVIEIPIKAPISFQIGIDSENRIWVQTFNIETTILGQETEEIPYEFHVFDSEGVFLGVVPAPVKFMRMRIYGDNMFLTESFEEMQVYKYRIVEK
ncbi:6-bladed beta-propeller [candidate division KSB1 bacterium]